MTGRVDLHQLRADDLRHLLALANTGRLVAAADALAVDHTTVSRRVRALEKALGVRLVERGVDGWELTETGRSVAEHARPVQEAVERAAKAATGAHEDSLAGTFRITAPDGFGTYFVAPALTRLRERHPDLSVELITATRQLSLHQSGFDLAIAIGRPGARRLRVEKLSDYDFGLYASEDYLSRHGEPESVDDLRQHPFIFYIDSLLQVGDLDFTSYLPGVTARFTSTNLFAQVEATRSGAGIALLPKFMARRVAELRSIDVGQPRMKLAFSLAARRESVSRRSVQVVREALREEVAARQDELL